MHENNRQICKFINGIRRNEIQMYTHIYPPSIIFLYLPTREREKEKKIVSIHHLAHLSRILSREPSDPEEARLPDHRLSLPHMDTYFEGF